MGIKDFFRKVGNGFKKAGRFIKNKVFPVVGRIAKPVLGILGALPGKLGMIGKIGSAITGSLTNVASQIPNNDARNKVQHIINQGNDKFQGMINTGQHYTENVNQAIEKVRNDPNFQKLQEHFKKRPVDTASKIHPK